MLAFTVKRFLSYKPFGQWTPALFNGQKRHCGDYFGFFKSESEAIQFITERFPDMRRVEHIPSILFENRKGVELLLECQYID